MVLVKKIIFLLLDFVKDGPRNHVWCGAVQNLRGSGVLTEFSDPRKY